MALLTVRNVETYYGPIMAIRGVSLEVNDGGIVAVLGANGAGKTTVLKTVSGAMDPRKGTVDFDGRDITGRDPDRVARMGIGHVPEGREVFPFLSVEENLVVGAFSRKAGGFLRRPGDGVRLLPGACRAPQATGGISFRGRAADARHRPRVDVASETDVAR